MPESPSDLYCDSKYGQLRGMIKITGMLNARDNRLKPRPLGSENTMTKSELIERIAERQVQLSTKDVELAVKCVIDQMVDGLSSGERIEIRGFGSFSLHYRKPRVGRNPKTGERVELSGKYVPHFKPGKELRERVNDSLNRFQTSFFNS